MAEKAAEIVCLTGVFEESVRLVISLDPALSKKLNGNKLIRPLLEHIDGRGGGKPHFVQGGGKKVDGLDAMIKDMKPTVKKLLNLE